MSEGDELLALIQESVRAHQVPPAYQAMVTEMVALTVVRVMSDPRYLMRLQIVMELQQENVELRRALAVASATVSRSGVKARKKAAPRKKAAAKRATVRAPQVRVKGSTSANRQAFREGYSG